MAAEVSIEDLIGPGGGTNPGQATHFVFDNKMFNVPGAVFAMSKDTKEPAFYFPMGANMGCVPLNVLRREFNLQQFPGDAKLVSLVEQSLKYVKEIRPNDSIPKEILDGSASWRVSETNRMVAEAKLYARLVSWITGRPIPLDDIGALLRLIEQGNIEEQARAAAVRIADDLEITANQQTEVMGRVKNIARETAYIEALKEFFETMLSIQKKIDEFVKLHKRDSFVVEELLRMQMLIKAPINDVHTAFKSLDMRMTDIITLLREPRSTVEFIRHIRDGVHRRLLEWDDMIKAWTPIQVVRKDQHIKLFKETYRFLAQNYAEGVRNPISRGFGY